MKKFQKTIKELYPNLLNLKLFTILFFMFIGTAPIYTQTAVHPIGSGTETEPFIIADVNNLFWITQNTASWDKHFVQIADIDASSINDEFNRGFRPIGLTEPFTGTYDGNNHIINGMRINNNYIQPRAMFGKTSETAEIKNLKLINVDIRTEIITEIPIGAIVGENHGVITNCFSLGNVKGEKNAGGLVGINYGTISQCFSNVIVSDLGGFDTDGSNNGGLVGYNAGDISFSYASGDVYSKLYVGGFVGTNEGTISNCYARGEIKHTDGIFTYLGGFVGRLTGGSITNCYSTGGIEVQFGGNPLAHDFVGGIDGGTISNSFWLRKLNSTEGRSGAQGLSSLEMRMANIFLGAGWDFELETTNGNDDIWDIDITRGVYSGYPYLWWQDGASISVSAESPTLSIGSPDNSITNTGPVTFLITFSSAASTIDLNESHVTLIKTGTANAFVEIRQNEPQYLTKRVVLRNIVGDGTLSISLETGIAYNILGVGNAATGPSEIITVDNIAPTSSISGPSNTSSIFGPVTYDISYSEFFIVNLKTEDVILNKSGTANADINIINGTTTEPQVELSNFTGSGTLGISLAPGSCIDEAGNPDAGAGPSETFTVIDETIPLGSGTEGDPYIIEKYENLVFISENSSIWDKFFVQISNIDASHSAIAGFSPIGFSSLPFNGTYNGNGFEINGLEIDNPGSVEYIGLFGFLGSGAIIQNLELNNFNITGNSGVGSLVGGNSGTVSNCSVQSGFAEGLQAIGGLVGANLGGTVINCYSLASVNGSSFIGGFVGFNTGSVINSYSAGIVGSNGGGFVGNNSGSISNCFWDSEASGVNISAGGTPKTTQEMKTLSTFTGAGWDFAQETNNGTNDDWFIDNAVNNGYPFLNNLITTLSAGSILKETAILKGIIGNNLDLDITSRGVVFSSEDSSPAIGGISVIQEVSGSGSGFFTKNISSLSPGTTYYYRAYGITSSKTIYGEIVSFTTDFDPPIAICKDVIAQLGQDGIESISAISVDGGSTADLGIESRQLDQYNFTCSDLGDNTITLTVIDAGGNSSTCIATVTVEDNVAPDLVVQSISVQLDDTGNAFITSDQIDNGSDDNCGIATLSVSPNTFNCSDVGDNTVTLTATDESGNISTSTSTVTIENAVICPALPIELLYFSANSEAGQNNIKWGTSTEINVSHFEVLKSSDGADWRVLDNVLAVGNSIVEQNYQIEDPDPYPTTYYRLKSIDQDGSWQLSYIVSVSRNPSMEYNGLEVYPNPSRINGYFRIRISNSESSGTLLVSDMKGQVVLEKAIKNPNEEPIDCSNLSAGVYVLRYIIERRLPLFTKLVIE